MKQVESYGNGAVKMWAIALALSSLLFAPYAFAGSGDDYASIRNLVERFFNAYQREDLDGLMSLWSEKAPELAASKQSFQQAFAANDKTETKIFVVRKVVVEGEKATVRVALEMSAAGARRGKPAEGFEKKNRTLHLAKESGEWKVWKFGSSEEELAALLAEARTEEQRKELLQAENELVTVELVKALQAKGNSLWIQGSYSQSLSMYVLTGEIANQLDDRAGAADALRGIGNTYISQGEYSQALEYYEKSLRLSEEIGYGGAIARVLSNIGTVHQFQGRYAQSLDYYQRSLKTHEEIGNRDGIGRVLVNIGIIHRLQGNYTQALECYQKSLEIAKGLKTEAFSGLALVNVGNIYLLQGNPALALEYYQKGLKVEEERGAKDGMGKTLCNMGEACQSQGNYAQALEYYQRSLNICEEHGDKYGANVTLGNIGVNYALQGNYNLSLEYYQRSLAISEEIGDKEGISRSLTRISVVNRLKSNYEQAAESATRAAEIARQIGSPELISASSTVLGQAYQALKEPLLARKALADAIAAVEEQRNQVAGEQERQRFFEGSISPYYAMVDLLIDQEKPADALAYSERARSRTLLDTLQSGRVNITRAMTSDEQQGERKLNQEIVTANIEVLHEKQRQQPQRLAELNAGLQKARIAYEAFQLTLYARHPELKVQRGQMQPIGLVQTSSLIPDTSTAVLEYVVAENKSHLFVLTRAQRTDTMSGASGAVPSLKVYTINITQKDLVNHIEGFRRRLASLDFGVQDPARELYTLLLGPARAELKGKTNLIIVPDGALWELPFQALQPAAGRYLIEDAAISYAPSLTVLLEMTKRKSWGAGDSPKLLALGNPAVSKETTAKRIRSVLMDENLNPLPEAERQVKELGKLYGAQRSKIYIGPEAQEARVKTEAAGYGILHLAAHGILNDKNPMYSQVVLSQPEGDINEDGMLEAWEVMNLDLKADLVVLSACETARGRVGNGEGMIGLSWAFFVAGVPTTVASQWNVEAASTTELMVEFHRNLERHKGKAESLRQAMLKLLKSKEYNRPFYWAGFVVVGNGR